MIKIIDKKKLLVFSLFLLPKLLFAQETVKKKEQKFLLHSGFGPSVPLSDYGNRDLNDPSSGLAKTGLNYQLCFNYLVKKNLGIGAKAYYFYNPQDAQVWLTNFLQNATPNQFFKVNTHPWEFKGVSAGLYGTFEIENNQADVKFLIGYANVKFPSILVEFQEGNLTDSEFLDAQNKMVPTFEIDFALRFPILSKLDVIIDFSFLNTEVQFDVFDKTGDIRYGQNNRVSVTNITLGCGYKF